MRRQGLKWAAGVCLAVVFMVLAAVPSYARPHQSRTRNRHVPFWGLRVVFSPKKFAHVSVSGVEYYYHNHQFYSRHGQSYVVAAPPVGAYVSSIGPQYQPVTINGILYYTDGYGYYVYTAYGYQVVPAPVYSAINMQQPFAPVSAAQPAQAVMTDEGLVRVTVPKFNGGSTLITLKRSGNGFFGPRGEYYPVFPSLEQLRLVYGN